MAGACYHPAGSVSGVGRTQPGQGDRSPSSRQWSEPGTVDPFVPAGADQRCGVSILPCCHRTATRRNAAGRRRHNHDNGRRKSTGKSSGIRHHDHGDHNPPDYHHREHHGSPCDDEHDDNDPHDEHHDRGDDDGTGGDDESCFPGSRIAPFRCSARRSPDRCIVEHSWRRTSRALRLNWPVLRSWRRIPVEPNPPTSRGRRCSSRQSRSPNRRAGVGTRPG
jgi:hypothetical protein